MEISHGYMEETKKTRRILTFRGQLGINCQECYNKKTHWSTKHANQKLTDTHTAINTVLKE